MAIANTAHGGTAGNTTAGTSRAVTISAAVNETIIVAVATVNTTSNAPTDNATPSSNTYVQLGDIATNTERITLWGCLQSKSSVTTVTATFASSRNSVAVATYTGVTGFVQTGKNTATGNTSPASVSTTIAPPTNHCALAGFANKGTATWSADTGGNLRNNIAGGGTTTPGVAIVDSIGLTAIDTCIVDESAGNVWAATIIELDDGTIIQTASDDQSGTWADDFASNTGNIVPGIIKSFSDAATWVDFVVAGLYVGSNWNDTSASALGTGGGGGLTQAVSDINTWNESIRTGFSIAISDIETYTDTVRTGYSIILSDIETYTDIAAFVEGELLAISDAETFSDTPAEQLGILSALSDINIWSDSVLTGYSIAISDLESFSDAINSIQGLQQSLSDIESFSDTVRTGYSIAISDVESFTDTTLAIIAQQQAISDAATFSDSFSIVEGELLSLSDINTWADAFTSFISAPGLTLNVSDIESFSDVVLTGYSIAILDAESWSDVLATGVSIVTSDINTWNDSIAEVLGEQKSVSDTNTFNDSFSAVESQLASLSDSTTFSDSVLTGFSLAISDIETFADSVTVGGFAALIQTASDIITFSDAFAAFMAMGLAVSDSNTWSDTSSQVEGQQRASADINTWSDSIVEVLGEQLIVSDINTWAAIVRTGYSITLSELTTFSDNFNSSTGAPGLTQAVSDIITFSDSEAAIENQYLSVSDGQGGYGIGGFGGGGFGEDNWQDDVSTGFSIAISDSNAFSDTINQLFGKQVLLSDTVTWAESISTGYSISIAELQTWDDVFAKFESGQQLIVQVEDSLILTDTIAIAMSERLSISDINTWTDTLTTGFSIATSDIETWNDTFSSQLFASLTRAISDTNAAAWNDTTNRVTGQFLSPADITTFNDNASLIETLQANLSDTLNLVDSSSAGLGYQLAASDIITFQDDFIESIATPQIHKSLADIASFSDDIILQESQLLSLSDNETFTDAATSNLGLQQLTSDINTWVDQFNSFQGSLLLVSDIFQPTDSFKSFMQMQLAISDISTWSDSTLSNLGLTQEVADQNNWFDSVITTIGLIGLTLTLSDIITWSDSTNYKLYPQLVPVIQAIASMPLMAVQDIRCINKINVQGIMVR